MTPPFKIQAQIGTKNITWGAGAVFLDVTDRCFSFAITRGRTDYTRPFSTGTATFTFRNLDGWFDPDNPTGMAQGIKPGRQVIVTSNPDDLLYERIIYVGFITDIELSYDLSGQATATFTTADALSLLAQEQIAAGTTFPAQTTSERFNAVLALPEIDYAFLTDASIGISTCAAGSASGNVSDYLNKVVTTEQGAMFVSRSGALTFRNRYDILNASTETFSDDGNDIPYESIARTVTSTELYNRLQANRAATSPVIRESATSAGQFGIRFLNLGEVLFASDGQVTDMLDYAMVRYGSNIPRVATVTTMLDDKSEATIAALVGLELTDSVTVEFTPPGTTSITIPSTIEQIIHRCTIGGKWLISFGFSPRDTSNYLVLDDLVVGKLDENVLAF